MVVCDELISSGRDNEESVRCRETAKVAIFKLLYLSDLRRCVPKGWQAAANSHPILNTKLRHHHQIHVTKASNSAYHPRFLKASSNPSTPFSSALGPDLLCYSR